MDASAELPFWANRVPDVACFVLCDDLVDEQRARACFGGSLRRFRLGSVPDHARAFCFASWTCAAAGEGALETGEVALPALFPCSGASARGVAIVDVVADGTSWARFFLGEPGFKLEEVPFEAEDGQCGMATARLAHSSDEEAREQEGGDDNWFMSMWADRLWFQATLQTLLLPEGRRPEAELLQPLRELQEIPSPGVKLTRCDGCGQDFASAHLWRCHVEHEGCPDSMFFPMEVEATRPEPMRLSASARAILPAPMVLRRTVSALRRRGEALVAEVLDTSLLMDRQTSLRAYLDANPALSAFVLGGQEPNSAELCRWDFCPLLRAGPLEIHRGSEARPHAIRRSLLQQGSSAREAAQASAAGCRTLDAAVEYLQARRKAAWLAAPRVAGWSDQASRVCVAFEARLDAHCCDWPPGTPGRAVMRLEGPQRTHTALEQLWRAGLLQRCCSLGRPRMATEAELVAVHSPSHVSELLAAAAEGRAPRGVPSSCDLGDDKAPLTDVYVNQHTAAAALLCAGMHAEVVARVVQRELDFAMCLTRPPGHHAGGATGTFSGGCFVNNVSVAARVALASGIERVLIVDWDVHHGDGTQQIFYDDPSVLTIQQGVADLLAPLRARAAGVLPERGIARPLRQRQRLRLQREFGVRLRRRRLWRR
ncbi:unnamed protein product [Prorocentrum cordatum]|uniref:Histone deacetylase domain-containing protein n=1 Tax=Prorocentrum cordatum TaxID=2364126 RepID=A0ABN9W1E9_9DINO|nr:unnamed protein product [Polarella glacialis]